MLKTILFSCLVALALSCGTDELECNVDGLVYCYQSTQYSCQTDPILGTNVLCAAGTSPCKSVCIADCGYFCNVTSGLAEPNDQDELVCPPDCSRAGLGFGACGQNCVDVDDYCCISENAVATASCPFNKPAAATTLGLGCTLTLRSVGQLWDGQLRASFGPGASPVTFTLANGQLTDNRGEVCYISLGNQVQCNTPPQTTDFSGFGVTSDGYLTYNNSGRFWQCPVGTGGYNIFTTPTPGDVCTPLAIPTESDCPKPIPPPTCTTAVDIAVVVDMSGSVSDKQFAAITTFTINFASSFSFGAQSGRMGLVWFGNTGTTKTSGLLSDRAAFIAAANTSRPAQAQSSCVGCGLSLALQLLNSNSRSGVPQVLLLLSDGQSNVPQNTPRGCWLWNGRTCVGGSAGVLPSPNWVDVVPSLRSNSKLTVFSIGVVADGNLQENILKTIASPNAYLCIGSYDRLVSSVNKIKDASCPAGNGPTTSSPQQKTTSAAPTTKASTPTTSAPQQPAASTKVCPTKQISIPTPWLYFTFDSDFSGSTQCRDSSGNSRHGTSYGLNAGWGYWKQGAKCSGSKQYISVPKCDSLPQDFSVATWINITDSSDTVTVAQTNQWTLSLSPKSSKCYFSKGSKTISWDISLKIGTYFHFAFATDKYGNSQLYKDGASVGSSQNCGSIPKSSGTLNLCSHDDNKFNGVFDDLLIFGECLTSDKVQAIVTQNHCV